MNKPAETVCIINGQPQFDMSTPVAVLRRRNGEVDDVAITGDTYRLERMGPDSWWTCIYRGDKATMFMLRWDRKHRQIVATVTEDTIGCTDDTPTTRERLLLKLEMARTSLAAEEANTARLRQQVADGEVELARLDAQAAP